MATTLFEMRKRSPTPMLGRVCEGLLKPSPIMNFLRWEATTSDSIAYRRRRGDSTAPHFSPDSTISAGNDEVFDHLIARIRPFGGQVEEPVIGMGFGNVLEGVESKAIAAAKRFGESLIVGNFVDTVTYAPAMTANDGTVAGPYWDLNTRGEVCILRVRVNAAERFISIRRGGDSDWGPEYPDNYTAAQDMVALADGTYRFRCANPNYYLDITLDTSDLSAILATTNHVLTFGTTNNEFDGLYQLAGATSYTLNVATAAGESFDIKHLDRVLREMKTPGQKALLVSERDFDALLYDTRTLGGATFTEVSGFSNVLRYRGALVMSDPWVPTNLLFNGKRGVAGAATDASSIIGVDLEYGVRGLYKSDVPQTGVYDGRTWAGLYVRNIGESETKDNEITRLTWYASIMHLDSQGLVVLDGIIA